MRDLIIALIIGLGSLSALNHPWIGILVWTWVSIMNPHRLSYAMANQPVAMAVALSIFIGFLITKDKRQFVITPETIAFLMFVFWILGITYPMSIDMNGSSGLWSKVWRADLMIVVAICVIHSRAQIMSLAWVLAFSIGFFGFKGGIFTIAHGGAYKVWGPDGSWIEGNNELALAMIVVIPLIRFLQTQIPSKRGKQFCTLWMILTAFAALGSHSRGALLAIVAMAVVMVSRAEKNKFGLAMGMIVLGVIMAMFMPKEWTERMETTQTYKQDGSAMGRINAWMMCLHLANSSPIFGGGFHIYTEALFARYAPDPLDLHVAHSIYFSVLGEHGYVGLALFLWMWFQVWRGGGQLRAMGKKHEDTKWVSELGAMCQVSLVGYAVGGAFLSLAYFDLPYNVLALVVVARRWVQNRDKIEEIEPNPKLTKYLTALGILKSPLPPPRP